MVLNFKKDRKKNKYDRKIKTIINSRQCMENLMVKKIRISLRSLIVKKVNGKWIKKIKDNRKE